MRVDAPITFTRTSHIVSSNIQSFYIQILEEKNPVLFPDGCILDENPSMF